MDNLKMGSYNDRISEIRARVMSKQRDRDVSRDFKSNYANENSNHLKNYNKYDSNLSKYASGYRQKDNYQGRFQQYQSKARQTFDYKQRVSFGTKSKQKYAERKPLEVRKQTEPNVLDRVKQLQSVNDKIKMMLANKREPYPSTSTTSFDRSKSRHRKYDQQNSSPKKIISLFQNEKPIVQSKVASRQKRISEYESNKIGYGQYSKQKFAFESVKKDVLKAQNYFSVQTPLAALKQPQTSREVSPKKRQILPLELNQIDKVKEEPLLTFKMQTDKTARKPSFQPFVRVSNRGQSKKLIDILTKQIQLDIKLRESKQKFSLLKDQFKFDLIAQKVKTYGAIISKQQLDIWTKLTSQQSDPFFEMQTCRSFDYDEFAARIVSAWQCWNNQVKESVEIQGLEKQGFKIQEIDLAGKGYLTMQDFVCYINISADTFFRKRDICQLFRRLTKANPEEKLENRLNYETFLGYLVK